MKRNCVRAFTALLMLVLTACGGGSQIEARIGGGGTGAPLSVGVGSVDGFGSVIVNGVHYDERDATIIIDERPDQPTVASVAALRLGMHIAIEHRNFVASRATVAAEVIGPVSSIAATGLTVLGQSVRVNADPARPTVFDGFVNLGDLGTGARVEVHGERANDGAILATRIALRGAESVLRVAGTVANLSATGFMLGDLVVTTAQAAVIPAGQTLANGARVAVWTDLPLSGQQLAARVIRIGAFAVPANAAVTIDGVVGSVPVQGRFSLGEISVDLSGAQIVGGNLGSLVIGRSVRVHGTMSAGTLHATRIELINDKPVELTGPITDFAGEAEIFKLRASAVRVTPQTTYVAGSAANLGDGVVVKLEGKLVNGVVEAQKVEFLAVAANSQRVLFGNVAGPVTVAPDGARTFGLEGMTAQIETTAATEFKQGVATDLVVGRRVKLKVGLQGARLIADEVQFMDVANVVAELSGTANKVTPNSFEIDGRAVDLVSSTIYLRDGVPGSKADLVNGAQVEVRATRIANRLVAQSVDVTPATTGTVTIRGIVSDRTPPNASEFRVGAQRVSVAGNPQVIPGNRTVADIRNGQDLEVTGVLSNGVLTATRIKFR